MSPESQSPLSNVRITYHADGSATVNGVPVAAEPGQDVRDAAYQAAVGLVVAAGANGPVAATSIETDGTAYPLTLYPLKVVYPLKAMASASALANGAGGTGGASRAGAGSASVSGAAGAESAAAASAGAGASAAIGSAGFLEGRYRRVRRAWHHPTLSMSWLVAGACACMVLSVLATVLLQENDPSPEHLQVDTENEVDHSSAARALGRVVASLPATVLPGTTTKPSAGKHPSASAASTHAGAPKKAPAANGATGNGSGVSQSRGSGSSSGPRSAPSPKPRSAPGDPGPVEVTNLALALVGGDKTDLTIAYVVTISTTNTNPITLTYTYAGRGGHTTVKRSVMLSGQTEYVLADLIPGQLYCGGPVTVTVSTSPAADNGAATATTHPGC